MRIAFVSEFYNPSHSGGIIDYMNRIIENLDKHQFTIITSTIKSYYPDLEFFEPSETFSGNTRIVRYPTILEKLSPFSKFLIERYIDYSVEFRSKLKELEKFDIVNFQKPFFLAIQAARHLKKIYKHYVFTVHGLLPHNSIYGKIYDKIAVKYMLKNAVLIVVVSRKLKKLVMSYGIPEDKIRIIPNGYDKQKTTCTKQIVQQTKSKYHLEEYVLFV